MIVSALIEHPYYFPTFSYVTHLNKITPVALVTGGKVQLTNSTLKGSGMDLIIHKPFKSENSRRQETWT